MRRQVNLLWWKLREKRNLNCLYEKKNVYFFTKVWSDRFGLLKVLIKNNVCRMHNGSISPPLKCQCDLHENTRVRHNPLREHQLNFTFKICHVCQFPCEIKWELNTTTAWHPTITVECLSLEWRCWEFFYYLFLSLKIMPLSFTLRKSENIITTNDTFYCV